MSNLTSDISDNNKSAALKNEGGRPGALFSALVAAIGFIFTVYAFYPGVMSSDSLDQFQQALNFRFSDWHPPAMAIFWSGLAHIWRGPQLMLLMQEALFWGAVYLLLSTLEIRALWARLLVVGLLFSPALLNFSGVIWKDVQLTASWLFVLAFVYAAQMKGKPVTKWQKAFLLLLGAYGGLVRINAGIVVGPLVLYVLVGRPRLEKLWLTLASYLGLAAACFALGLAVKTVFPVERSNALDSLYVFDLAGLSTAKNENLFPFPLSDAEFDSVKTCYGDASRVDPLIWGACDFVWKKAGAVREQNKRALVRAWRSAVLHAPHLYVAERLKHLGAFLALTRAPQDYIWLPGFPPNAFGYPARMEGVYPVLGAYVQAFEGTVLFRPVFWFGMTLFCLLSLLAAERGSITGRMILTAGMVAIGYLLTYLPFGVGSDFRYANLSIALTVFAFCAVVSVVARKLEPPETGEAPDYSLRSIFLTKD